MISIYLIALTVPAFIALLMLPKNMEQRPPDHAPRGRSPPPRGTHTARSPGRPRSGSQRVATSKPPAPILRGRFRRWGAAGRPRFGACDGPLSPSAAAALGDLLRLRHGTSDDEFPVDHEAGVFISPVAAMVIRILHRRVGAGSPSAAPVLIRACRISCNRAEDLMRMGWSFFEGATWWRYDADLCGRVGRCASGDEVEQVAENDDAQRHCPEEQGEQRGLRTAEHDAWGWTGRWSSS